MVKGEQILFFDGTATASGSADSKDVLDRQQIAAQLVVNAASGTSPTLDVVIEDSADGVTWNSLATFTQKTTAGSETVRVTSPFNHLVRASYTIGGTSPSFDFHLRGTAK